MARALKLQDVNQKLRIVKPKPPGDAAVSTTAYQSKRVSALEDGINLNREDGGLIRYADISMLFTFRLDIDPNTWYIDLFVYGTPGAFRMSQKAVNYRQFLSDASSRDKDNFHAFVLHLIDQTDSVHVDDHTFDFLKNRKITSFPDFKLVEDYTKQLWSQVFSWMKFQCDQCGELYWVDDAKVSEQGAKTKCVKCQNIITVQKREKPAPLILKESPEKIVCPHCQYENQKGAEFCVMCHNSLTGAPSKTPQPSPRKARDTSRQKEETTPISITEEPAKEEAPPPKAKSEKAPPAREQLSEPLGLTSQPTRQKTPYRSFREIEYSMRDDVNTLEERFGWFTRFSLIMKVFGYLFLVIGVFLGIYLRFVLSDPPPPAIYTVTQRWTFAGIAAGIGILFSLASFIASNVIAAALEIERNSRMTVILLQKLLNKWEG
jgi:predicted Zn finger-like uncharacterized protein